MNIYSGVEKIKLHKCFKKKGNTDELLFNDDDGDGDGGLT